MTPRYALAIALWAAWLVLMVCMWMWAGCSVDTPC